MNERFPFDPLTLPMEPEARTRERHASVEWRPGSARSVFGDDHALDPAFADEPRFGVPDNVFTDGYEETEVHVTSIEDGVLVGQQFLVCDRLEPTLSPRRIEYIPLRLVAERWAGLEVQQVESGPVYLVGASNLHHNFYHWCAESLPSIALLREVSRERGLDYRIVLPPLDATRKRSLELLGIVPSECVTLRDDRFLRGVPLLYTNVLFGDMPYRPSLPLIELLEPYRAACLARANVALPTRFYVSRRDSPRRRRLENEPELAAALAGRGYRELSLSSLPLEDQVALFAGADTVVSPHGAGLVNLMFASPPARLIEIMPARYRSAHFFRLAQARGVGYSEVRADIVGVPSDNPRTGNLLRVDVAKVLDAVERSERSRATRAA